MTTEKIIRLGELAERIALKVQSLGENLSESLNSINVEWNKLPEPDKENIVFCPVDGGSRTKQLSGSTIIYAQAAGRPMGTEKTKGIDWQIEQDAEILTSGTKLAEDLAGQVRLRLEVTVAANLIEKHSPDILLLDGTLNSLFLIGMPSRLNTFIQEDSDDENLESDLSVYRRELIAYGDVLREFMDLVNENSTTVLSLSKDSYSKLYIPDLYSDEALTDTVLLRLKSQGEPGYTNSKISTPSDLLKGNKQLLRLWQKSNPKLKFSPKEIEYSSFYTNFIKNGIPFRTDIFNSQFQAEESIISKLLQITNGQDWLIPPRLAHEAAVVRNEILDHFYHQVFVRAEKQNPKIAHYVLTPSRRERTQ